MILTLENRFDVDNNFVRSFIISWGMKELIQIKMKEKLIKRNKGKNSQTENNEKKKK